MQPPETSFELVDLILSIPATSKSKDSGWDIYTKGVLVAVCRHTKNPAGPSWPSIHRIAYESGASERKVSLCLEWLKDHHLVDVEYRPNQSSRYWLHVGTIVAMAERAWKAVGWAVQETSEAYETAPKVQAVHPDLHTVHPEVHAVHHLPQSAALKNISPSARGAPDAQPACKQANNAASQRGSRAGIYTSESREPIQPVQADTPCSAEQPVQPVQPCSAEQPNQAGKAEQPIPADQADSAEQAEQPGMSPERDQPLRAEQTGRPYTAPSSLAALHLTPERAAPIFAGRPAPAHLRRTTDPDPNDRYRTLLDRNRYAGMLPQRDETEYDPLE